MSVARRRPSAYRSQFRALGRLQVAAEAEPQSPGSVMQPTLLGALNSRQRGARQTAVDRSLRRRGAAPNRGSSPGSVARRGLLLWWTSGVLDLRRPDCRDGREGGASWRAIGSRPAPANVEEQLCRAAPLVLVRRRSEPRLGGEAASVCRSDTLAADRRECSSHGEAAPFYARSRRESPPPTAPSTNPISGGQGEVGDQADDDAERQSGHRADRDRGSDAHAGESMSGRTPKQ